MMIPPDDGPQDAVEPPEDDHRQDLQPHEGQRHVDPAPDGAQQYPPTAETIAEMLQARANIFLTLIPMERATCWLDAVARMATPDLEYLKKSVSSATRKETQTSAYRYPWETGIGTDLDRGGRETSGNGRVLVPYFIWISAFRMLPSPRVTMITEIRWDPIRGEG